MERELILLLLATLCFGGAFASVFWALRQKSHRRRGRVLLLMGAGFFCQCIFLYGRGQAVGRCPITSLSEVLVFLAWAVVIAYFLFGSSFQLSLLGIGTAPLVALLQIIALFIDRQPTQELPRAIDPWVEFHAAVALLAYGFFALAAVAGFTFRLQDGQLKSHRPRPLFFQLPPLESLGRLNVKLLGAGFLLLSASLLSTLGLEREVSGWKVGGMLAVWVVYGVLLSLVFGRKLTPKQVANWSIFAFGLSLLSLAGIEFQRVVPPT